MKLIVTLLLFGCSLACISQTCPPNIDFEIGDLSNWQCFTGNTYVAANQNVINLTPSGPTANRHQIITTATAGMDQYGNFPTLCPYGGGYSVKLGNNSSGSEAEGLSYTFQIPASADTFSLTYFYAVVFEDPGHLPVEQPRFFVTAYDVATGNLINCASYNYISTAAIPGFQVSTVDPGVLYKNWTPASIDFSGLAGQTVRLEFKTADCTKGAHFGYAYVDVGTGCGGVITVAALCGSSNSVALNAPYGFQSYTWYNSNYTIAVGNQQNVTLTPPPPPNTMFHVDMVPYPGFGCRDTADALVTSLPVPDTPVATTYYYYCQNASPQLLTATPTNPNTLLWYTTATGGVGSSTALLPSTAAAGVFHYYVTQKVLFGCESVRKDIIVTISPTPITSFNINNDRQCLNTNNFVFTSTSGNTSANSEYSWDFGDGNYANTATASHSYTNYGSYTVKLRVTNPPNCFHEITRTVNVVAAPSASFSWPQVVCEHQTGIVLNDLSTVPGNSGVINQWHWIIGTSVVTSQNPIPFQANGGPLPIQLYVATTEGCRSDTFSTTLQIHYSPKTRFNYGPLLCDNETIQLTDLSTLPAAAAPDYITAWNWLIDNTISSTQHHPIIHLAAGIHHISLIAETNIGCKSAPVDSVFTVYHKPEIRLTINDSCANRDILFSAISLGPTVVSSWHWNFGNGFYPDVPNLIKRFSYEGYLPINLVAKSSQGCKDTVNRHFNIYENHAYAGNDTIVAIDQPVQLNAGGTDITTYNWIPATGLNNNHVMNPIAIHDQDQLYQLNTMSVYGCDAHSKVFIRRYKGPTLYIPNAFTPNGDHNNDVLKVFAVGIKTFYSFAVYNRFGTQLFYTTDLSKGWDGTYRGSRLDPGSYVFYARALDYKGKILAQKGSVLLLR